MSNAPAFAYTARDSSGRIVKGRIEANSQGAVLAELRTMGVSPITVQEARVGTGLRMELKLPGNTRVKTKDLAVASRQLATMMGAGLSLIRALNVLAEQTGNKELARLLHVVRGDVEQGLALSESLAKHPRVFPPLMIHLVRAGETGGFLDKALLNIAATLEADVKLRDEVKSALTYPVIVLIMAVVATLAMLLFIVPIFEKMFASLDSTLPAPTRVLVALSHNMYWFLPLLVVLVIVGMAWWRRNKHTEAVRSRVDPLRLRLPVFGQLIRKIAIARFARNLSTMIGAGVPILQGLDIVGETSGNWVVERAAKKVQESVRQGKSIAAPLAEEPIFPSMVVQMVSVGEDSGALETMLDKVGEFYEAEVAATTKALTSLIEPLMIAVIGVVIGGMIVALYLPVFTIYNHIH